MNLEDIHISDIEFWARPWTERNAAFATLRRERPIAFFPEPPIGNFPEGPGYYAITRHADILTVSRNPDVFSSAQGAVSILDMPAEMNEFYGSMISMDDPRHARLRRIVSGTFTPKMLGKILEDVQKTAVETVDAVMDKDEFDLVEEISSPFPLIVICDMMGIPASERAMVLAQSNIILSGGDPEFIPEGEDPVMAFIGAGMMLAELMNGLAAERRITPTDDLLSALVNTSVEGEQLTPEELASFFILLAVAGNETTRNAISHGLLALSRYPEQREIWWNDFDAITPSAVEEIVRWASPVVYMRRTATRDVELSGVTIAAGDKVSMWYASANRDEDKFDNPWKFDVTRTGNNHVGFGGGGVHFCLGANLARREISLAFEELHRRIPDITVTEEPAMLLSAFIHGIKRLPVSWTPQ